MDRIWKDIGTYRNVDYVAPNKAKVDNCSLHHFNFVVDGDLLQGNLIMVSDI